DLRDLLVGPVDEFGVDTVLVHVLAAVARIGGTEDAGLGLLGEAGAGVAIDRAAADPLPADTRPHPPLDDPLADAVRAGPDARRVILKAPRQALGPQIERQVHQPAMAIGGDDAKSLFHRAFLPERCPNER